MDIPIVYMVAGLSSRFGGKIKQFAKVGPNNETLIEYSLNQALKAGFNKIIFVVGNNTEKPFKEMFRNTYKGIPVQYTYQKYNPLERDKPWGTVDALCSIKEIINCGFVICNGDDIYGESSFKILFDHLKEKDTSATVGYNLLKVLPEKGTVNRGIFEAKDNKIASIKEIFNISKENLSEKGLNENSLANMNIFAFQPEVLEKLNKTLIEFKEKYKGDRKIECLLPTEINNLIKNSELIIELYPTSEKWLGITNPEDEFKVKQELQKQNIN